jgi:hypothetical protein
LFSMAEPSWQTGGREFDPRQLHQQNKQLTRFPKLHFSSSKANICILLAFLFASFWQNQPLVSFGFQPKFLLNSSKSEGDDCDGGRNHRIMCGF